MDKYYTGIGSRETPAAVKSLIGVIVHRLNKKGYTLRSGGAEGADTFFEDEAIKKEIYLPWKGFNGNNSPLYGVGDQAIKLAKLYHPFFDNLSQGGQKLIARNGYQVLGRALDLPSKVVICWTKDGKMVGGTAQAMRIAQAYKIPIFNLALTTHINKLLQILNLRDDDG